MARGRKPLAHEVKQRSGAYRKDPQRENKKCPKADANEPKCPSYLSRRAKAKWDEIVVVLREMRVLSTDCGELLALYCEAYDGYLTCLDQVKKQGVTAMTKHGEKTNPLLRELHKYRDGLIKMLPEFGLTPSSRGKLAVLDNEEEDPFEVIMERMSSNN